jgi:polyhydroxybutyrate depolymerase
MNRRNAPRALAALTLVLASSAVLAACSSKATPNDGGSSSPLITDRPYDSYVPPHYDPSKPAPLVVMLHGYGATPFVEDAVFGLTEFQATSDFLLAEPSGRIDSMQHPFWNATDACCDFDHTGVDDVAYLNAVIDDMQARYNVDPKRIFVTGHSNGGFMSYRLACDASPRLAAIVSLAGAMWLDTSKCKPTSPVAVLEVHGDADNMVAYGGTAQYPSAAVSVGDWAMFNGCAGALTPTGRTLDLDATLPGAETVESTYACTTGAATLWTIHGGNHVPNFQMPTWAQSIYAFMQAHPKP